MSGQNVPYHLRTNKFVERHIFADVLDFVRIWNGPSKYLYASMGGRFLEDFKLINERFAIEQMVSIEADATTWQRQYYNRPFGYIDCRLQTSGEFIVDFDRLMSQHLGKRFVIWLDYASANERGIQLQELHELVSKLASGDVVKITLNANVESFRRREQFEFTKDYEKIVIDNLREQLGDYLPRGGIDSRHLNPVAFAQLLSRCVETAVLKGNEHSGLFAIPLSCLRYHDGGHTMLTVTTIFADPELNSTIASDQAFQLWPFRSAKWEVVYTINVPDISARERLLINQLISGANDEHQIHEELPFLLEADKEKSKEQLKNYLVHYRRYPVFGKLP